MKAAPCQSFHNILWVVAMWTIANWSFLQGNAQVIPCDVQCHYLNESISGRQDYLQDCIVPTPPFVSSIGSHNVTLRWDPANITEATYMVQSKYVSIPSEWENDKIVTESSYTVHNLQPYTEYFFRVIWIICHLQFYSQPSPAYRTLPSGVPTSAPLIESLQSSSSKTIEVSWLPPFFPNGPIIAYKLELSADGEIPNHISVADKQYYQFYGTKPTTTYRLSIRAVNTEGEGPTAEHNITTLGSPVPDKSQWFFISRNDTLKMWENLEYDVHEAECLTTRSTIHSVSVNVGGQAVYFSEENNIWLKRVTNMTDTTDLKILHIGLGTITSLSVDWLQDKIYFIMYNQIYTCSSWNCSSTANIPLDIMKPKKIVVDPYNGYLFLLLEDGIHRMILPEPSIETNITEHIVKYDDIQDFILTFQSKRIVCARKVSQDISYLISVFLDGTDEKILRSNSAIKDMKSFLYFSDSLIFTDGDSVWYEEFFMNTYFYNQYLLTCEVSDSSSSSSSSLDYNNMILYAESAQPVPLPGVPEHLLVVFGTTSVEVLWKPPMLTVGASPTAWQKWTYSISILSEHGIRQIVSNDSTTQVTLTGLDLSTHYEVTVQASSPAGNSKWTDPVVGTTLCSAEEDPHFLAVGVTGIWRQPLDRFGPGELISDRLRYVTDMDWYNGTIYWSNETGHVHIWKISNTTENSALYIPEIRRVGPLTYDWIGQFIYWADKMNPKIYRTSLRTHSLETIIVSTYLVNDLAVDSINAFLYWSTGYTVESSRLNGQDHVIIHNLTFSSSSQVVALTLNLIDGQIYWLVKTGLDIHMYHANIRKEGTFDVKVTEYESWGYSEISQHALMFHCNRLFWINGQKYITVQEVNQSSCTPISQPAEFTGFILGLNALKPLPGNLSHAPDVTPGIILNSSIEIKGYYSDFTIQWTEPSNIEYGTLFYCVESAVLQELELRTRYNNCLTPETFTETFYTVKGLEPYTEFDFAVTPYTYWAKGITTSLNLHAPEGVPSSPLNPRVYKLQNASVFETTHFELELRWDPPIRSNGVLINFAIYYSVINESKDAQTVGVWVNVNTTVLSFILHGLSPGLLLQFQVQAYTSVGPGPLSEMAEAFISDVHPAPVLISTSSNKITFNDVDRKQELWKFKAENIRMISYIAHDEKLFFVDNDTLFLSDLKSQSTVLLLEDVRLSRCQGMTADWIGRRIYVAVRSEWNSTQILFIDLELKEKVLDHINTSAISPNLILHAIVVYPLLSRIYWIESWESGNRLSLYDIINDKLESILGHHEKTIPTTTSNCDCVEKNCELGTIIALDTSDKNNPYIFFLCNATNIWASDLDGCHCWNVISVTLLPGASLTSFSMDNYFIYWSMKEHGNTNIYHANKIDKVAILLHTIPEVVQVTAYSTSLQPFPDRECLILASHIETPIVLSTTNTSITLHLPLITTEVTCPLIKSSTPTYRVIYWRLLNADQVVKTDGNNTTLEFQELIATISDLQPFSYYTFEVSVRNYYIFLLDQQPTGVTVTGKTAYGVPGPATIMNLTILSDSLVNITWTELSKPNGPNDIIRYQIKANSLRSPASPLRKDAFPNEILSWSLNNLEAGTDYEFQVLAFHPDEAWYSQSSVVHGRTFNAPSAPHNIVPGNVSLVLEWKAPEESIKELRFQLKELPGHNLYKPTHQECTKGSVYICLLLGVVPNTIYQVQAVVLFLTGAQSISHPTNFKTLAGVPTKPGIPQKVPGDDNTIQWKIAQDNGSNLTYNILEYRKVTEVKELDLWTLAYSGSCGDICVWKSNGLDGTFQFRAAAANMIGLGNYSDVSENILLYKEDRSFDDVGVIVGSILGILLVLLLLTAFVFYKRLKQKQNKCNNSKEITDIIHEDKELSKLRGLSNAVGLANACYAVSTLPTKREMENLPSFPREDLELCVFLGSGAFGEVYQGIAKNILGPGTGSQNVAVKTLKSDATDQEKVEFLKEAHLMSQFQHSNILKLLGVCLHNEPQYIILELMDGGDLLSYLRGARANTHVQEALLSTVDLLDMSMDICTGCFYLEKMHFVHRDLAARNCLVSVKEYHNPRRMVKIGDFGLARDVYKSDYYRKKGEGLLPVRWMAPESLIDGIFTTRSDVWSFGVLLWELFSLGQQPYQGYSNMEVLHFVRSGQRMDSPDNCPDDMWNLMLKCWAQNPAQRPIFARIQKQLEELKGCSLRCTQPKGKKMFLEGIDNAGFEVTDTSLGSASGETGSLTLTEARNVDGLNYLIVTT
ncbi:proto-oncogene tyrosine-protein kinase ROS [Anomaloglossus baeobatrachus]|uniref:proto-oncogene tyrosine-protein kinase ROS n=1 Tax=Anomaloglossus baeobatrachus TaxID=238106 RepID=UPI003F5021A9